MTFEWLARPPCESVVRSLEALHALGALGDDARLTSPLGAAMAELPLEPAMARALLAGAAGGCSKVGFFWGGGGVEVERVCTFVWRRGSG
jgi:HrpA-like RNA helicase